MRYSLKTRQCSHQMDVKLAFGNLTKRLARACTSPCGSFKHGSLLILRKEVIQPHLPIRLPCYDFTPVIAPALGPFGTSGVNDFRGVTGGVYKARERIHRSMLTCDY